MCTRRRKHSSKLFLNLLDQVQDVSFRSVNAMRTATALWPKSTITSCQTETVQCTLSNVYLLFLMRIDYM